MTERASDLLTEVADRLSDKAAESGLVAAESVRAIEPELLKTHKDGTVDELVKASVAFLEVLFRSLRTDSRVPWHEYYSVARDASRRYADKGVPLESLMEGLAVFRRSVIARVTDELVGDTGDDRPPEHCQALHQGLERDALVGIAPGSIPGHAVVLVPRHPGAGAKGAEQDLQEGDTGLDELVHGAVLVGLEELRLDRADRLGSHQPALGRLVR